MTGQRGRVPGPLPRGTCSDCGHDHALRADGTVGSHRRRTRQGYRLGYCPGVGQMPAVDLKSPPTPRPTTNAALTKPREAGA